MKLIKKLSITGSVLISFSILIFIAFPPILKSQITKFKTLAPKSKMRNMWANIPFSVDFKIYLYNITNPDEIDAGAKPIVKEIGPFYYEEWIKKINLTDHDEDDTVEYNSKSTWKFNLKKSALDENVRVIFPNLFMLAGVLTLLRERPALIGLGAKGLNSVLNNPNSLFVQTTPKEILWDGFPINCSVNDTPGTAVCIVLRDKTDTFIKESPSLYRFAAFASINSAIERDRIRIKRGVQDVLQLGRVTKLNGKPKMSTWPEDGNCNHLSGTDGTIYHPFLYKNEDITTIIPRFCRNIHSKFEKYSKVKGISSNRYQYDFGDMSNDPELKCFCATNTSCLKKGLYDLYKCIGAPVVLSLPHFYLVDDEYLNQVDGVHPNKDEHESFMDIEPLTGTPLIMKNRIQFNAFIHPIEKFKWMKTFPTSLLPIFWTEECILLSNKYMKPLRIILTFATIFKVIKWICMIVGLCLIGIAGNMLYRYQRDANKMGNVKIVPKSLIEANFGITKDKSIDAETNQSANVDQNLAV